MADEIIPSGRQWARPTIKLYCDSEDCRGDHFFEPRMYAESIGAEWGSTILYYICRHCQTNWKIFAVRGRLYSPQSDHGEAAKIGEWPPFGPYIPSKVITLIREDKELFTKGRRAESQGLGIGAFAYYRRVVENQKNHLIDQIIKVAKRTNTDPQIVATLEAARKETQFSKAVELIKDAIPPSLRIDDHNPLQLLHAAMSKGIHELSDQECLENASTIRLVLTDLAERISQALKDHRELHEAIGKLTRPREPNEKDADAG